MYNLHTHTLLSDGALLPSEVAVRYLTLDYRVIAITDHADYSNIDFIVNSILNFTNNWPKKIGIKILPGIELTHLPLEQFSPLARYARKNGIQVIVAHGETLVEPVIKDTNRAALEADIDILAHPGMISGKDCLLAKKKNIFLEITARKGHRESNPHVAQLCRKQKAKLILNNDSHQPEDIISPQEMRNYAMQCGLTDKEIKQIHIDVGNFLKKKEVR